MSHAAPPTPKANAATASAPPTASNCPQPASAAAASVTGAGRGDASLTMGTPATRAAIVVISTEDGSG